jgi:hypothetical protein
MGVFNEKEHHTLLSLYDWYITKKRSDAEDRETFKKDLTEREEEASRVAKLLGEQGNALPWTVFLSHKYIGNMRC